jgi:hypothetical protein
MSPGNQASPPPQARRSPQILVRNQMSQDEQVENTTWYYAHGDVILYITPDGRPHRASSASMAPLTILDGTRLRYVKTVGQWVMVASPSNTFGWVEKSQVRTSYYDRDSTLASAGNTYPL